MRRAGRVPLRVRGAEVIGSVKRLLYVLYLLIRGYRR